jgi:hypothetical protein
MINKHEHEWPARRWMVIRLWLSDTHQVPDSTGTGMRTIFYPLVTSVPDPNRDGYGTGIFFHPWITRWVPDILLPL